jgi:hypothetical protein
MLLATDMQGSFGQYATTVGDALYGLRLLQDAAGRLPRTAPLAARARLALLEAVSLSYLRDRAALKALDGAERYADASFHADPVWPWVFQFDSSKIASYRSSRMPSVGVKIARRLAAAITSASAWPPTLRPPTWTSCSASAIPVNG